MAKAGLSCAMCTIQYSLSNHVQAPAKDSPEYNALYSSGALEGQIEAQRVLALRYLAILPCFCPVWCTDLAGALLASAGIYRQLA